MPDESDSDFSDFDEWVDQNTQHLESDRKRGILTKKDREYLLGELEIDGQDERNLRYRMRQRVIAGLLDICLLGESYPDEELEDVLESDEITEYVVKHQPLHLYYRIARILFDNTDAELTDAFEKVIKGEHRDHYLSEGDFHAKGAIVELELSTEPYDHTLRKVVTQYIDQKVSTRKWESLNNYVGIHFLHLIPEDELDDYKKIDLQPPGADETILLHPILADTIREVENERR